MACDDHICRAEFSAYQKYVDQLYASHLAHVTEADRATAELRAGIADVRNRHDEDQATALRERLEMMMSVRRAATTAVVTAVLSVASGLALWWITHS